MEQHLIQVGGLFLFARSPHSHPIPIFPMFVSLSITSLTDIGKERSGLTLFTSHPLALVITPLLHESNLGRPPSWLQNGAHVLQPPPYHVDSI